MKTILSIPVFLFLCLSCFGAGYKISDLERTNTVGGGEWVELDQAGIKSWRISTADFWRALGTNQVINLISIQTNINNYAFITNLYAVTVNITTNIVNVSYVTNQTVYQTNIANYTITTNLTVYQTNINNVTITTNLTVYETNINNWSITTNLITYETNYVNYSYTTNLTVQNIANVKSMFVTNITVINSLSVPTNGYFYAIFVTNAAYTYGPFYSFSITTNSPAANEFVTASWVRGLFNNGLVLYSSTNYYTAATNVDEQHIVWQFTNQIPPTASRYYATVNAGDYIGSVATTNRFTFLQGPIYVHTFMQMTNGVGNPTVSVHPELYYSYDATNWFGDFSANNQNITTGTNLYEWVISFPAVTATNTTGFIIERRFKVGTATGATHPDVVFHMGTNYYSGTNDASHIAISGTSGGGGGGQTIIITNVGVLGTNIAYTTNQMMDFSAPYNDYQQTNACTNHILVWLTNLVQGASVSLSIQGASATYTNFNVYFYWPPYATVTWLSITNGTPTTTITSNKLQFYSFLVRTNHTQTNVIASFKEQP